MWINAVIRTKCFLMILVSLFSPAVLTASGFTVKDALGRTVHFERAPTRIVCAGRGMLLVADCLFLFPEASSRIVAMSRVGQGRKNFLLALDPLYEKKAILSHEVGPEQIAAARPDAVVLKSYLAAGLGRILESLGIQVVYLSFETPQQYEQDISTIGSLFQNEERADEVSEFFRSRAERVKNALFDLNASEKPKVLLLSTSGGDCCNAFNVPSASWMQTALIEIAGGLPVWKDMKSGSGWTKISFEQIAAWDPDYIFITAYFHNAVDVVANLRQERKWSRLSAVRNERFYAFPADFISWDQPDPRWILGLTWCAKKMHPARFRGINMMGEVRNFYRILYGIEESALRTQVLPLVHGDVF